MNFNLVEMYNGLLRFNKHILNELAEGLKHLPNLDGVSKGDNLIINEQGNPAWGSAAFIPTFENAAYGIEWTKDDNDIIRIGNAKNLLYKIQSLTGVRYSNWNGKRTNITKYYGKYVRIIQIINYAKYFRINFIRNGKAYYADSRDKTLFYSIHRFNHFLLILKLLNMTGVFMLKIEKKKLNLKHNIL